MAEYSDIDYITRIKSNDTCKYYIIGIDHDGNYEIMLEDAFYDLPLTQTTLYSGIDIYIDIDEYPTTMSLNLEEISDVLVIDYYTVQYPDDPDFGKTSDRMKLSGINIDLLIKIRKLIKSNDCVYTEVIDYLVQKKRNESIENILD